MSNSSHRVSEKFLDICGTLTFSEGERAASAAFQSLKDAPSGATLAVVIEALNQVACRLAARACHVGRCVPIALADCNFTAEKIGPLELCPGQLQAKVLRIGRITTIEATLAAGSFNACATVQVQPVKG